MWDNTELRVMLWMALIFALAGCGAGDPIAKRHMLTHTYGVHDAQFERVMSDLLGPHIAEGNTITTLVNGDAFYPAQLEAIRGARESITFETYMYWKGTIGRRFAEELAERARNGVRVHVTIDSIGSDQIDDDYIRMMREAGATVVEYHPITRLVLLVTIGEVTHRTHRKLLVVDGKIGFIGGAGIADLWMGDARNPEEWRDTFYRVEGPVVAHLQAAFADNWLRETGDLLDGEAYFPELTSTGDMNAQVFLSSPEGGSASMELMYLIAATAAAETIDMGTPYFVPDDLLRETLLAATARGVRVRLIVPGPHLDQKITKLASRTSWKTLLEAGVEIYEYQPTMYHNKIMIVDGYWTSVGSANLDSLSFRLNDEANLNVHNADFAQEQVEQFEEDVARSKRVTVDQLENRSFLQRALEFLVQPLKPLL